MKIILRIGKKIVEDFLFRFFCLFPINEKLILFESEGDLADNSYALYDYMKKNGYFDKYRAVWIVNKDEPLINYSSYETILKWTHGVSLRRLYLLATCKYSICDHTNVLSNYKIRKNQVIVNLFHGCTFKRTKGGARIANTEKFMPVTGDFWKSIMAEFVRCDRCKVISLGYPRNDYFFSNNNEKIALWEESYSLRKYSKTILWMPTFRKSTSTNLSEDYYKGETGLPIIEVKDSLGDLNELLKKLNVILIIKVHHLQLEYQAFKGLYSNIQIIKDSQLIQFGLQLYQMVSLADVLITDYSSISNDFMLLDRPMIFTLNDYDEYRCSRGFAVDDPAQYYPGHHVFNKNDLFKAIEAVCNGEDPYKTTRRELLPVMHKFQDGNSSKRIIEYIGLNNDI